LNSVAILSLEKVSKRKVSSIQFYRIPLKTIEGTETTMETFKGQVILIVNVASKCGFTPQYKSLETLYEKYKSKGFVILGFPCNNFLWQEPGSEKEIKNFCSTTYGVSFPLFSKLDVMGKNQHPLYQYLTSKESNPRFSGAIKWNFTKFLISRNGEILNRFGSSTDPLDENVINAIDTALSE